MTKNRTTRRVLVVETGSGLGGSARALGEMLRSLDMSGLRVTVLFTRPDAATRRIDGTGVEILKPARPLCRSPRRWPGDATYLWGLFSHIRPAVIHLNNELYSSVPAILAARARGIPIVCHLRSQRRPTRIEKLLAPLCRRLVAISRSGRKYFRRRLPGAGGRIEVIRDGFANIESCERRKNDTRPVTLGMTSNLVRGKGHAHVLEAMPRILRMFPQTRLAVAGCTIDGDECEIELRQQVEALGLSRGVTFAGWQDDIAAFMEEIDILIDASCLPEGYRHTIVEGMRAGLPVIATDVGPVREIIRTAAEGMIVPPHDAEAIAEAVCMLLENPCRMREMARNSRRAALQRFRTDEETGKMENLYRTTALSRRG